MLCDLNFEVFIINGPLCNKNFEISIIVYMGWQIVFSQSTVMSDYQCSKS